MTVPFGCSASLRLPLAGEAVYEDKDNPMFARVEEGLCILEPGSYSVAYETTEPLIQQEDPAGQ